MSNGTKMNIASYKVFKTLLFLFNESLTMEELVEKMNSIGYGTYNNFVISKYVNTCKSCTIDIQKLGGKYDLLNFPFGEKYTPNEACLLNDIMAIADLLKIKDKDTLKKSIIQKLHLPHYKSSNGLKSNENYRFVRIFEKACVSEGNVKITFIDNTTKEYFPISINVKNNKIFLKARLNETNTNELIDPNKVIEIEPLDKKIRRTKINPEVVEFLLKGKLAKRYQPRENEMITLFKRNGDIVITNKYEEKTKLLHRLMRYDSLCKIIKPKSYVDEFKQMINNTLANYQ